MMGLSRCCLTAWWWGSLSRPVDVLGELALDRMLLWVLDMLDPMGELEGEPVLGGDQVLVHTGSWCSVSCR